MARKRGVICATFKYIQGVYQTFKLRMFRVGGSCNFPILCAHFLQSYALHPCPQIREGCVSCHTCCDMGFWLLWSHPKSRQTLSRNPFKLEFIIHLQALSISYACTVLVSITRVEDFQGKFARWQSVRLACRRSGFNSRSGQTYIFKTGSDSLTAKHSTNGVSVTDPQRLSL